VQLVSKIAKLCGPDPPTSQTDRRTDGRTTCNLNTAVCTIVHRAVKTRRRKRKREFFYTDNQSCTDRVTFCYSLTLWTLVSHAWVDWVWMRS